MKAQALELPGRLGALGHERHPLAPRDRLPLGFLVDHDGIWRVAEEADRLGMLARAQDDDRVALVDELLELTLLGQHHEILAK
jgi:hypothetical protein